MGSWSKGPWREGKTKTEKGKNGKPCLLHCSETSSVLLGAQKVRYRFVTLVVERFDKRV